jgi:MoxR-like ATPase
VSNNKADKKQEMMGKPLTGEEAKFIAQKVEEFSKKLKDAKAEIAKEVKGQDDVINHTLTALVARGNILAVGVPGVAKTYLVERVARVMNLQQNRVQFTPDLMPSDITGSEVLEEDANGKKSFRFIEGPVFTQMLMADEINRAGPRTQAALLQAMQEKKVTTGGQTRKLSNTFNVFATQNPLEQEGTYPLPEAQLDRFLVSINVDYPDADAEKWVIVNTTGTKDDIAALVARDQSGEDLNNPTNVDHDRESKLNVILGKNDLYIMQKVAARLPMSEDVVDAILDIVRNSRPKNKTAPEFVQQNVAWGPGPRAGQAFAQLVKARALMDGRLSPSVDDVLAVAPLVLEHRMALSFSAKAEGHTYKDVQKAVIATLKV